MAIITFSRNDIISAINGSGIIERSGVKIEFNNCYINEFGNPNIKAEINERLPVYHTKGKGGNIENGRDVSNYRYLKDYGTVKISCNNSLIVRVAGLDGADNHHIYNPSYKNIDGVNYKFVSSGVKDVTFLPTINWIYGCKKDNIEYKTFWDDNLADNGEAIVHVDNRSINKTRLGYQDATTSELITINAGYTVETNVIDVDPGSYPYICKVIKIHGNVLPQQLDTDEEVYMLPVLALEVDEDTNNQFYITGIIQTNSIGGSNNGNIIVVTDDTFEQIEGTSIIVNALEGAELDIKNNCYIRKIIAPEDTMFNEITIKIYFEDKNIDALDVNNTKFIPQTQIFTTVNPVTASNNKLLRQINTIVNTESATVDCIVNGEEKDTSYECVKTATSGKLLREVKSIVNFEDVSINTLESGEYEEVSSGRPPLKKKQYVRNPYTLDNKLIRSVSSYVDIQNPVINVSDILEGNTLTKIDDSLIDYVDLSGLTEEININIDDITDVEHEYDYSLIPYPLRINVVKEHCNIDETDIKEEAWLKKPNKSNALFNEVFIDTITSNIQLGSIEKRDITFVEPRIPTVYYGVYIQLLKKMSDVAPELLKDCNCGCNSINQKLISLWAMFNYACAEYFNDVNSKVAANIIKTIVSQLNIIYKEDKDFLITRYYVGSYKNKTNDENEFDDVSIYKLTPIEIDICGKRELINKINHNEDVHYIMIPPDLKLKKVWFDNGIIKTILFDSENNINEYNVKYHKFTDYDTNHTIYWYYSQYPISDINIELEFVK